MSDILTILHDHGELLLIGQYPNGPLGGVVITFLLAVLGIALALPLGVTLAVARTGDIVWLRRAAAATICVVRGVPLVMFIFWVYFFWPLLIGRTVSGFTTMLVSLVIYQAAYLAEIVRAGIEGLPKGQMEAARAVGLSYLQATFKVILPQAIYNMLPSLISQFVSTIKETSLGYVISVNELTFAANQINSSLLTMPFQVFAILAASYFVLCFSLTQLARHVEHRIARKHAGELRAAKPVPVTVATPVVAD